MRRLLLLMVLGCVPFAHAQTQTRRDETAEKSFRAFLAEWEAAQARLLAGDPAQWKRMSSQGDDATIMGAYGGYERGWEGGGATLRLAGRPVQ